MNEINTTNNIFNITKPTLNKAGLVNGSQNGNSAQNLPQSQPQPSQTQQQTVNPNLLINYQTVKMDNETVLKYLQNLLNLPNSIDKFVNQLNSKNIDPKIMQILTENMINVKALGEFLNQNSNQAISKLLQIISESLKNGNSEISQLKEILTILNTIQANTNINTNTLKEIILLYIPLSIPVFDKEVDFDVQDEEEKRSIKNSKMSILLETKNFSNILCCINQTDNDTLITTYTDDIFPKEKYQKIISALSKEINTNIFIDFKNSKNQNSKQGIIQNFKITSDGFIPINLLILAHLVIKTVFKIDSDFSI